VIKSAGIEAQVEAFRVKQIFHEVCHKIMHRELAARVKATHFRGNILTVASISSLAMREIQYFEEKIIAEINNSLGTDVVRQIDYLS